MIFNENPKMNADFNKIKKNVHGFDKIYSNLRSGDPIENSGQMVQIQAEEIFVIVGEEELEFVFESRHGILAEHLFDDRDKLLLGEVAGIELCIFGIDFVDAVKMNKLRHF